VKLYRDEAIVLRTHDLGEADRIITMLTRNHGKVRGVAKGVRRTKSRFGARLEPFAMVDVQLYEGRGLDVVAVYGGAPYGPQIGALRDGAQVVVGTPGRLIDLLRHRTLDLGRARTVVLDEADEMLDLGFLEDVERILAGTPPPAGRSPTPEATSSRSRLPIS